MRLKYIYSLLPLLTFAWKPGMSSEQTPAKIPLSVLYVGYSPEKPMPARMVYYATKEDRFQEIYKNRMADFHSLLEGEFTSVKTVDVLDYNAAMSNSFDVTIIDAGPVNLPANFDKPVILISAMAPNVGIPAGLKFDWYCQCLDGEALNIRSQHEIFNFPKKVKLTMVNKPLPLMFAVGYHAVGMPKEMPRWKVSESYSDDARYLVGMVSHGEGFDDSPDAEVISGGVNGKNAAAVALGRQGNYFMWGFAESPKLMTEEAKMVFVNAVCYIKKYDKKVPIVKKVQNLTRPYLKEKIYWLSKEVYQQTLTAKAEDIVRMKKMQQELRDKKAKGENIGKGNEMFLQMKPDPSVPTFEDYLKNIADSGLFERFGTNTGLYRQYYIDNYEYFYPQDADHLQLDTEAKALGISNRKVDLLAKCIDLLLTNQDTARAKRILERYTTEKFSTAQEWKNWLVINGKNLFYTESGGFKFMINTFGQQAAISPAPFPVFTYPDTTGKMINLNAVKGKKATVVIFWASWCAPCRKEIPKLRALYDEYQKKGIEMLSISVDQKLTAWKKAVGEEKMPWPNVADFPPGSKPIMDVFGIKAVPSLFLIDENLDILLTDPTLEELENKLKTL